MSKKETIQNQLTKLAFQESIPFCYSCYMKAETDRCDNYGTDDLMHLVEDTSCEYGMEWVIEEILRKHLEPVNEKETFEQMIEDCYSVETKVGWLELDTIDTIKTMCPCDWELAKDDYIYSLQEDEGILSFDNEKTYFWISDIEQLIEDKLKEKIAV